MTARPRDPGQAGVTMVEMAVVVALLGLVLTMAMQGPFLPAGDRLGRHPPGQPRPGPDGHGRAHQDLRTATAFTAMTATDVTFTGLLNTAATAPANQLRLWVDSNWVLREAVTPPDDPNASPLTYTGSRRPGSSGGGSCLRRACSATGTAPTRSPPA